MACSKDHEQTFLCAEGQAASGGIDSNLEQTRTIVASLQTAVDFVKVLSESLAVVTQLLASSTMTDVQESITLLIYCHKFQVCPLEQGDPVEQILQHQRQSRPLVKHAGLCILKKQAHHAVLHNAVTTDCNAEV